MTNVSEQVLPRLCSLVESLLSAAPPGDIDFPTALPWLNLIRRVAPTATGHGMLTPSVCLLIQGEKEILTGERSLRYGAGSYLQAGMPSPVSGHITRATAATPYYGIRIDLDPKEVTAIVLEMNQGLDAQAYAAPTVTVERAEHHLLEAFARLLSMVDRTSNMAVLGRLIKEEIIYYLLSAPGGTALRCAVAGSHRDRAMGEAINWIRTNFSQTLRISTLARSVNMSPSVLHRRFKATTMMSPLQYQKQVRLLEARKILMSRCTEAAGVAFEVGYESPSQFNREYRRLFGLPPMKDAERYRQLPSILEP